MKKEVNAKQGGFYRTGREADVQSNQRAPITSDKVEDRHHVPATNHVIELLYMHSTHSVSPQVPPTVENVFFKFKRTYKVP